MNAYVKKDEILSLPLSFISELYKLLSNPESYDRLVQEVIRRGLTFVDYKLDCQITVHSIVDLELLRETATNIEHQLSIDSISTPV